MTTNNRDEQSRIIAERNDALKNANASMLENLGAYKKNQHARKRVDNVAMANDELAQQSNDNAKRIG